MSAANANNRPRLNRRSFLAAAGGVGAAAALPSLTACGGGSGAAGGNAEASAKLKLPAYAPAKAAPPDIAGTAGGLDPVYLRYPTQLVKSVAKAPGDGKPITALTETWMTPAPSLSKNRYMQELNKRLGSTLDMTVTQDVGDGYLGKFNAIIASGDIPDLVWFPPNQGLQKVPQLLAAKFHDLTKYLSGSAVKEFPNLTGLPTYSWKTSVVDGTMAGVTVTSGHFGQSYVVNKDFWKPVGGAKFDSADDFLAKCKDLLDVKKKKYVLEPAYYNALHMFGEWFGVCNGWRVKSGGKLEHMYESEEYKAALAFAIKVYKANVFWPDATVPSTLVSDKITSGTLGAYVDAQPNAVVNLNNLKFDADVIIPFAAESGVKPVFDMNYGSVGFTAISKSVPTSRIKTLLHVLDYLAAPMGTEEYLFLHSGLEGVHFKRDKHDDVIPTPRGESEALTSYSPVSEMCTGPAVIYAPGAPARAQRLAKIQKQLLPMAQENPTTGYYSDTNTNKGSSLSTQMVEVVNDVISGKKSMSDYESAVKTWRSGGGDAMRREYEKAMAKGKK